MHLLITCHNPLNIKKYANKYQTKIMKCETCMEFSTSEQVYHKSHIQEKLQVVLLSGYPVSQFFGGEVFYFEPLWIQYKNLSC
jgi:arabinogalactan endo-1,4-beta-galactosidase